MSTKIIIAIPLIPAALFAFLVKFNQWRLDSGHAESIRETAGGEILVFLLSPICGLIGIVYAIVWATNGLKKRALAMTLSLILSTILFVIGMILGPSLLWVT